MSEAEVSALKHSGNPGPLRGNGRLTIHTRQAQRLIEGRSDPGRPPILGMLSFGRRMRSLWLSAQHNDPYADWFLCQIEAGIEEARNLLHRKSQELSELLAGMPSVRIDVATSQNPIEVDLMFANPYGFMGAYLVADYDDLARLVFTARHFGLIDRKHAETLLHAAGNAIRRTFHRSAGWHFTGVTRDQVRNGSPLAAKARSLMGEVPPQHLDTSVRANCAPIIRTGVAVGDDDGEAPTLGFEGPPPVPARGKKPKPTSQVAA